jgi:hypothetical protein
MENTNGEHEWRTRIGEHELENTNWGTRIGELELGNTNWGTQSPCSAFLRSAFVVLGLWMSLVVWEKYFSLGSVFFLLPFFRSRFVCFFVLGPVLVASRLMCTPASMIAGALCMCRLWQSTTSSGAPEIAFLADSHLVRTYT